MPDGPPTPHEDSSRVRARERLARELHDEVAHRVASVSLQAVGHREDDDPARLRRSLDTIAVTTADILASLWLLERVLRAHPFDDAADKAGRALPHLAVSEPVALTVGRQARLLDAAGFRVAVEVPGPDEDVGPVARRTLEDAAVLSGVVIGRRAPLGSECAFVLTTAPGSAWLRVSAPVSALSRVGVAEEDAAAIALRERVRLTEGTLWMGEGERGGSRDWSLSLRVRDR